MPGLEIFLTKENIILFFTSLWAFLKWILPFVIFIALIEGIGIGIRNRRNRKWKKS